jgi:F-type H+-transporting ATPase subunit delta
MRGTSGASLAEALERFEPVLRAAGTDALQLGQELTAIVDALDESPSLRRTLADPSLPAAAKVGVVGQVLSHGFDARVVTVGKDLVSARWSADEDLPDAVERLSLTAFLVSAEARGALDRVEDELFRITRALQGQREVRQALSDPTTDPARRIGLVDSLLDGKADPVTVIIARRATAALRERRFVRALLTAGALIAERRARLVATVTSADDLTNDQVGRLTALLEAAYGQGVQLYVTVDPSVVGGLRVQVGSDVIDSTVLSRLADARRQLAS